MLKRLGGLRDKYFLNKDTWPGLDLTLHLAPWAWRCNIYVQDEERIVDEECPEANTAGWLGLEAQFGPFQLKYGHNRPPFTWDDPPPKKFCQMPDCTEEVMHYHKASFIPELMTELCAGHFGS